MVECTLGVVLCLLIQLATLSDQFVGYFSLNNNQTQIILTHANDVYVAPSSFVLGSSSSSSTSSPSSSSSSSSLSSSLSSLAARSSSSSLSSSLSSLAARSSSSSSSSSPSSSSSSSSLSSLATRSSSSSSSSLSSGSSISSGSSSSTFLENVTIISAIPDAPIYYIVPQVTDNLTQCIESCQATSTCTSGSLALVNNTSPQGQADNSIDWPFSGGGMTASLPGGTSSSYFACYLGAYEHSPYVTSINYRVGFYTNRQPVSNVYSTQPGLYDTCVPMMTNSSTNLVLSGIITISQCESICYNYPGCEAAQYSISLSTCALCRTIDYGLVNIADQSNVMILIGPTNPQAVPLSYNTTAPWNSQAPLTPIRGWNSYDAFLWHVNETQVKANALYVAQNLLQYGYNTIIVDYYWWLDSTMTFSTIDDLGYFQPDVGRFPSSSDGTGFTHLATYIHSLGLRFGVHVMPGMSALVNSSMKSTYPYIGPCGWSSTVSQVQVNQLDPSLPINQQWTNAQVQMFANWGVDYIKIDCLTPVGSGAPQFPNFQPFMYRDAIKTSSNPHIIVSLSPGWTTNYMDMRANFRVANYVRVGNDFWSWGDFSALIDLVQTYLPFYQGLSSQDVYGWSYPDMDMLDFGYIDSSQGTNFAPVSTSSPQALSTLTLAQQQSIFTIECMVRSPLFYGGNLMIPDPTSLGIITNTNLLFIHAYSGNLTIQAYASGTYLWLESQNRILGYIWDSISNLGNSALTWTFASPTDMVCDVWDIWNNINQSHVTYYNFTNQTISAYTTVLLLWSNCSSPISTLVAAFPLQTNMQELVGGSSTTTSSSCNNFNSDATRGNTCQIQSGSGIVTNIVVPHIFMMCLWYQFTSNPPGPSSSPSLITVSAGYGTSPNVYWASALKFSYAYGPTDIGRTGWHYACGGWNSTGEYLFMDGILEAFTANSVMSENGYLQFGGESGNELSADIQCVAVYNTVYDTAKVYSLYQQQNSGCSSINAFL